MWNQKPAKVPHDVFPHQVVVLRRSKRIRHDVASSVSLPLVGVSAIRAVKTIP